MIGFVYFLKNPVTNEIFYIGCTKVSLKNRLRTHYQHLRDCERGFRRENKRYLYLKNLMPHKAEIHLLEIVDEKDLEFTEIMYIGLFRSWGFHLTNQTEGGKGGDTYRNLTETRKAQYKRLLQAKLKDRPKPKGFKENLSKARTGIGNTMAGTSKHCPVACYKNGKLIKVFKYPFEVNAYLENDQAWGNIVKVITGKLSYKPYGYEWKKHKLKK